MLNYQRVINVDIGGDWANCLSPVCLGIYETNSWNSISKRCDFGIWYVFLGSWRLRISSNKATYYTYRIIPENSEFSQENSDVTWISHPKIMETWVCHKQFVHSFPLVLIRFSRVYAGFLVPFNPHHTPRRIPPLVFTRNSAGLLRGAAREAGNAAVCGGVGQQRELLCEGLGT